ncbi:hypothetical protein GCM10018963_04690 [Saccharothrix longispora]
MEHTGVGEGPPGTGTAAGCRKFRSGLRRIGRRCRSRASGTFRERGPVRSAPRKGVPGDRAVAEKDFLATAARALHGPFRDNRDDIFSTALNGFSITSGSRPVPTMWDTR